MMFFTLGAELSMVPMGERPGTKMAKSMRLDIVLLFCFLLGFMSLGISFPAVRSGKHAEEDSFPDTAQKHWREKDLAVSYRRAAP